jgi:hypothetical protein
MSVQRAEIGHSSLRAPTAIAPTRVIRVPAIDPPTSTQTAIPRGGPTVKVRLARETLSPAGNPNAIKLNSGRRAMSLRMVERESRGITMEALVPPVFTRSGSPRWVLQGENVVHRIVSPAITSAFSSPDVKCL